MADLKPVKSKKDSEELENRLSDATSKETLEDLEEGEKISNSKSESPADDSNVPSPDGTLSPDGGGRADGSETGGPM